MSDADFHQRQAQSFDDAAAVYERGRPPYPAAAVDWLFPDGAERVLDLGAGTGKLTRQLLERYPEVLGVDPSPKMLDQLRSAAPRATAMEGTAESIPLDDQSVDAVVVAQAWHWVDETLAVPEVARVLRPGGPLGLLWNARDERERWVAELGSLIGGKEMVGQLAPLDGSLFGPWEHEIFTWTHRLDVDELLAMVASRSYVIIKTDQERAGLLERVQELTSTHPDLRDRTLLDLPYVTHAFRARRK